MKISNIHEEIIIAKAGKPLVKLIPYQEEQEPRLPGGWEGKVVMSEDFDDELPANLLAGFMGEEE
jgi:antitoxin (DNA-binding transcriptional repressor) of toxin-antitoxin stability system